MIKTRFVFILPGLGAGGLERAAINLANRGGTTSEVHIISFSPKQSFYKIDTSVSVLKSPVYITREVIWFNFIRKIIWLRKTLKSINPDIICCFGERYNPYFILSSLGLSGKIVVLNRASPLSYISGLRKIVGAFTYRLADLVVFQTETAKKIVENAYGLRKTFVIGNPVDLSFPKINRQNVIINVGSFSGSKNQIALIEIFNDLVKTGLLDWQLHFVGSGINIELCKTRVEKYGLNSCVKFHGQVKDVKVLLASSEIFAFVSKSEGFPNALAEALASGCASISYDCIAGPADLIEDGENGFLIPLDNHSVYKKQLLKLIRDKRLRDKFSEKSLTKMRKFDANLIAENFYKSISI